MRGGFARAGPDPKRRRGRKASAPACGALWSPPGQAAGEGKVGHRGVTGMVVLLLAACQPVPGPGTAPTLAPEARAVPPGPEAGGCWHRTTLPARFETVTEQTVEPGSGPATVRSDTRQRMLADRREVWFRTPCAEEVTPVFLATLQRALKARGLYGGPVTGTMDPATAAAVRRYQAARGLDSDTLSLAAAREMGIAPADLSSL